MNTIQWERDFVTYKIFVILLVICIWSITSGESSDDARRPSYLIPDIFYWIFFWKTVLEMKQVSYKNKTKDSFCETLDFGRDLSEFLLVQLEVLCFERKLEMNLLNIWEQLWSFGRIRTQDSLRVPRFRFRIFLSFPKFNEQHHTQCKVWICPFNLSLDFVDHQMLIKVPPNFGLRRILIGFPYGLR